MDNADSSRRVISILTYVYDGSMEGMFTALYEGLFAMEEIESIVSRERYIPSLFSTEEIIETDPKKAKKLKHVLQSRLSKQAFMNIIYCYLSESGMEEMLLSYIKMALAVRRNIDGNFANETVAKITKTAKKVAYEVCRFHGFVRFRRVYDDLYYAPIEPDYNILALLTPHFIARFPNQQWFIHDRRRKLGAYYNGKECQIVTFVELTEELEASLHGITTGVEGEEEIFYKKLWNEYFKSIAIEERKNRRLQRQHMPARYWGNLVEKVE